MFGAAPSSSTPADLESVEVYRRYPAPEIVVLDFRPSSPTAPLTSPGSPAEPVAPRNRSPEDDDASLSSPSTSSPFTEQLPGTRDDGDERETRAQDAFSDQAAESVEDVNENKKGDYKGALASTASDSPAAAAAASSAVNAKEAEFEKADAPSSLGNAASISVRLRWGFEAADLRRVYEMHMDAFPLSYGPAYYEWLLNHDACMGLVATVTPQSYAQLADTAALAEKDGGVDLLLSDRDVPLSWFPGYTPTPAEAEAGPRPVPPPASKRPLTAEVIQEHAQIDSMLTDLEYIAHRKQAAATKTALPVEGEGEGESGAEAYTEVIGFILGQCAYARHDAGHLFTNPTTYIGSFAVDPRFQRCGLGSVLLERFLVYVTRQRPLYAQDFLHYDERKLIAMLAAAQLKKRKAKHAAEEEQSSPHASDAEAGDTQKSTGASSEAASERAGGSKEGKPIAADGDGSRHKKNDDDDNGSAALTPDEAASLPAKVSLAVIQVLSAYVPEALIWWEDRQARQRLRARGLSEDEINAQRYRDNLAPDDLTDEEAEAVRRDARNFLVQTGMREVWLHCLPGNATANTLYARRGFQLHRLLKDYYDIGGERYDANLLVYTCPVEGSVVRAEGGESATQEGEAAGNAAGEDGAALSPTTAAAANVATGMDAVVRQHDLAAAVAADAATSSAGDETTGTASTGVAGEGLRRRRPQGQSANTRIEEREKGKGGEQGSFPLRAPLPSAEPAAGIALATSTSTSPSNHHSGRPSDERRGEVNGSATPPPSSRSPPSPSPTSAHATVPAAAAPSREDRRSLARASWLSPRTYPAVADIILCTAAEGQEEWQRRVGATSGDVTGRRSWWETTREVALLINAVGLFCAVLWLAYNVGMTGKVE